MLTAAYPSTEVRGCEDSRCSVTQLILSLSPLAGSLQFDQHAWDICANVLAHLSSTSAHLDPRWMSSAQPCRRDERTHPTFALAHTFGSFGKNTRRYAEPGAFRACKSGLSGLAPIKREVGFGTRQSHPKSGLLEAFATYQRAGRSALCAGFDANKLALRPSLVSVPDMAP